MKFTKSFAGKWVAIHGDKVIGSSKKLASLRKNVEPKKGKKKIRYTLIPKGLITGSINAF